MTGVFKQSGLTGGVHFAETIEEVEEYAQKMCGNHMITSMERVHMKKGWLCNSVLIYEKIEVDKEFYVSIDYDRNL